MRLLTVGVMLALGLLTANARALAQTAASDPCATNDVFHRPASCPLPAYPPSPDPQPPFATARCSDGWFSFSQTRDGTCAGHGGVATWIVQPGDLYGYQRLMTQHDDEKKASARAGAGGGGGWQETSSRRNGYVFQTPNGWTDPPPIAPQCPEFFQTGDGSTSLRLCMVNPADTDPGGYLRTQVAWFTNRDDDFFITSPIAPVALAGADSASSFTGSWAEDPWDAAASLSVSIEAACRGSALYVINIYSAPGFNDTHGGTLDTILGTLRLFGDVGQSTGCQPPPGPPPNGS